MSRERVSGNGGKEQTMGALIAAITSLGGTIAMFTIKIFGSFATVAGGWMANIGWKLISFEWINKIYNFFGKVFGFLKKTLFNPKVVSILKIILTVGLFALNGVQLYFIAKVYTGHESFEYDDKVALALNLFAAAICVIFSLAFIFGLFKKKLRYGFISAILAIYFITAFSAKYFGGLYAGNIYREISSSFDTLKIPFLIGFAVLAILKLINVENPTSVFAFFLSAACAVIAYLLFKNENFACFVEYDYLGGELAENSNNVGLKSVVDELIKFFSADGAGGSGLGKYIVEGSIAAKETQGNFIAALILAANVGLILVSKLLPFVFVAIAVGAVMSMLNDRTKQCVYISRCIRLLKYAFWGTLVALICGICVSVFFKDPDLTATLNVGGYIAVFVAIFGLLLLFVIARKLIADKFVNKFKKYLG